MSNAKPSPRLFKVNVGLNYPDPDPSKPELRAEPGDIVKDLPQYSIPDLLELGYISPVASKKGGK